MKLIKIIALVLITGVTAYAQENQAETASSWEDGTYTYYLNEYTGGSYDVIELEKQGEEEIEFVRNENGDVTSIIIRGKEYIGDQYPKSNFIRYFNCEDSGWDLVVLDDKIVAMGDCRYPNNIRLKASFGGKAKKSDKAKIVKYLEETENIQAEDIAAYDENADKYDFEKRAEAGDIVDIQMEILTEEELTSGVVLEMGFILTTSDGIEFKTINLGGDVDKYMLGVYHQEVEWDKELTDFKHEIGYCEDLFDGAVPIIVSTSGIEPKTFNIGVECERNPEEIAYEEKQKKIEQQKKDDEVLVVERAKVIKSYAAKQKGDLPVVATDKINYFKVDRNLTFKDPSSHQLAVMKDGDKFIVLSAKCEEGFQNKYKTKTIGYYLESFDQDMNPLSHGSYYDYEDEHHQSTSFSSFEKTEFGYMVVNPKRVFYFDKNLDAIGTNGILNSQGFLKATHIKGTDLILFLEIDAGSNLLLELYNYKERKWITTESNYLSVFDNTNNISVAEKCNQYGLFITADNNVMVVAGGFTWDSESEQGNNFVAFFKYDLAEILAGNYSTGYTFYHQYDNTTMINVDIEEDGLLHGLSINDPYPPIKDWKKSYFFTLDPTFNTKETFANSLESKVYTAEDNAITEPKYFKKIGKYYYVFGSGRPTLGHNVSMVAIYNSEYELVGYNRLKNDNLEENAFEYELASEGPRISVASPSSGKVYSFGAFSPDEDVKADAVEYDYLDEYYWRLENEASSFDMAHISGDKFLIIQDKGSKFVSLNGGEKCELRTPVYNPEDEASKEEALMAAAAAEYEAKQNSSNSNVSASSTKESSENKYEVITIINDLSSDQQTKYNNVRLVFRGGTIASTSVSRGSTLEISCSTNAMYKESKEGSTATDEAFKIMDLDDYCGKTIKLSEVW